MGWGAAGSVLQTQSLGRKRTWLSIRIHPATSSMQEVAAWAEGERNQSLKSSRTSYRG